MAEVARGRLPIQETIEKDHGRIENRRYALSSHIDGLEAKPDWAGLQAVGRVESIRIIGDPASTSIAIFYARSRIKTGSQPQCAVTGASKINSIGSWTSNSGKMPVGRATITRRKTWP